MKKYLILKHIPEDPAFSTGGAHFFYDIFRLDKASNNKVQIIDLIESNEDILSFLLLVIEFSKLVKFAVEKWSTPGTKSGVFR